MPTITLEFTMEDIAVTTAALFMAACEIRQTQTFAMLCGTPHERYEATTAKMDEIRKRLSAAALDAEAPPAAEPEPADAPCAAPDGFEVVESSAGWSTLQKVVSGRLICATTTNGDEYPREEDWLVCVYDSNEVGGDELASYSSDGNCTITFEEAITEAERRALTSPFSPKPA